MRTPRFYEPQPLSVGNNITLSTQVHRHCIQVLRLKKDQTIILFNGQGGEYLAQLSQVERRHSQANITQFIDIRREPLVNICLCLSVIKPDKMDFAIQKAVELGVQSIQPLITERSMMRLNDKRFDKKITHWKGVIIAACEQSGRTEIPLLHPPLQLAELVQTTANSSHLHLAALPGEYPSIKCYIANNMSNNKTFQYRMINLIIGPEGGYTELEINLLLKQTHIISLGHLILRAETASTVTLAHLISA